MQGKDHSLNTILKFYCRAYIFKLIYHLREKLMLRFLHLNEDIELKDLKGFLLDIKLYGSLTWLPKVGERIIFR